MDFSLLASISVFLALFVVIGSFILKLWWDERNATKRRQALLAMGVPASPEGANEENRADRRPRRRHVTTANNEENNDSEEVPDSDQDFNGESGEKKIGKKKLAKLQAKSEAKAKREQEMAERAEQKRQKEENAKIEEQKRQAEEVEEKKRLERIKAEKEEKKRREQEEYMKLKASFAVEEHGFDQLDEEESENLLKTFIDYIKQTKVVYVDDLAAKFNLSIEDVVSRINQFMDDKLLNGVFDDRGKFICITPDELQAVAKFINQRGRVSVQELVDYSNRLISLESAVISQEA